MQRKRHFRNARRLAQGHLQKSRIRELRVGSRGICGRLKSPFLCLYTFAFSWLRVFHPLQFYCPAANFRCDGGAFRSHLGSKQAGLPYEHPMSYHMVFDASCFFEIVLRRSREPRKSARSMRQSLRWDGIGGGGGALS